MIKYLAFFSIAAFLLMQNFLTSFSNDLLIHSAYAQQPSGERSRTVDAIAVFEDQSGSDIYYSFYGHDSDLTWKWWSLGQGVAGLLPSRVGTIGSDKYPDVSYEQGVGIAVWGNVKPIDSTNCGPRYRGDIYFSIFDGTSWSTFGAVSNAPAADHIYHHPSVTVDRDGKAIAIWIHTTIIRNAVTQCPEASTMEVMYKVWNGTVWVNEGVIPNTQKSTPCPVSAPSGPSGPSFDHGCDHFTDITFTSKKLESSSTRHQAIGVWYDFIGTISLICRPPGGQPYTVNVDRFWPRYSVWDGSAFSQAQSIPNMPLPPIYTVFPDGKSDTNPALNSPVSINKMGIAADFSQNAKAVFPVQQANYKDPCAPFPLDEDVWFSVWRNQTSQWDDAVQYDLGSTPDLTFSKDDSQSASSAYSKEDTVTGYILEFAFERDIDSSFDPRGRITRYSGQLMPSLTDINIQNKTILVAEATDGNIYAAERNYGQDWLQSDQRWQGKNPEVDAKKNRPLIFIIGFQGSILYNDADEDGILDEGELVYPETVTDPIEVTPGKIPAMLERLRLNQDGSPKLPTDNIKAYDIIRAKQAKFIVSSGISVTRESDTTSSFLEFVKSLGYVEGRMLERGRAGNEQLSIATNGDFFAYPYDFRKDIRISSQRLDRWVSTILSSTGSEQVDIVTLSMGGLVGRHFASQHPEKISNLILLGSPNAGSLDAYLTLKYGARPLFGGEASVLPHNFFDVLRDVVRNWPSLYQQLPNQWWISGYGQGIDSQLFSGGIVSSGQDAIITFRDHPSQQILDKAFQAESKTVQIVRLTDWNNPALNAEVEYHLNNQYRTFWQELDAWDKNGRVHVRTFNIISMNIPTMFQLSAKKEVVFYHDPDCYACDSDDLLSVTVKHADGDETVTVNSARSLTGTPSTPLTEIAKNGIKHMTLANNRDVQNDIRQILNGRNPASIMPATQLPKTTDISFTSDPALLHILSNDGEHNGPISPEFIEVTIPNSRYEYIGTFSAVTGYVSNEQKYRLIINSSDSRAIFSLRLANEEIGGEYVYENVQINSSSTATIDYDPSIMERPKLMINGIEWVPPVQPTSATGKPLFDPIIVAILVSVGMAIFILIVIIKKRNRN